MKAQYDLKKEWPKIKKQLIQVSKEALTLAKKGEKEVIRISKQGKLHIDATALTLKKEHLYHIIGKEYVEANFPGEHTSKLQRLIDEIEKIDKQLAALKKKTGAKQVKTGSMTAAKDE